MQKLSIYNYLAISIISIMVTTPWAYAKQSKYVTKPQKKMQSTGPARLGRQRLFKGSGTLLPRAVTTTPLPRAVHRSPTPPCPTPVAPRTRPSSGTHASHRGFLSCRAVTVSPPTARALRASSMRWLHARRGAQRPSRWTA